MPRARLSLSREEARARLVAWHGLDRWQGDGAAGVRDLLTRARCIQLDPLDRIGTNADLVAMARVQGLKRGEVYQHLLPGHAFEHFCKERCLLPASAFRHYRRTQGMTHWWKDEERRQRVDEGLVAEVLAEITERGPCTVRELVHRGTVDPLDWNGWKGTSSASAMAVEVLWWRCDVVVTGRRGKERSYDIPTRALGADALAEPDEPFERWALRERVAAAGLLARVSGPTWSIIQHVRRSKVPEEAVEAGELVEIDVEGLKRPLLALPAFVETPAEPDREIRVLGPLDALIWDRDLVRHLFDFDYVWEVYKPAAQRRWGWYVCPLLQGGRLIGRVEARREGGRVVVDRLWAEADEIDPLALRAALDRLEPPDVG